MTLPDPVVYWDRSSSRPYQRADVWDKVRVHPVTGVHGEDMPVPYPELMAALGGLAANKRRYPDAPEVELRDVYQPQRTDLEPPVAGKKARYIEVTIEPGDA